MLLTLTGGSGAGKTTLAAALAAAIAAQAVPAPGADLRVLHGDDYYAETPDRGVWARDDAGIPRLDVGDPRSMDLDRLNQDTDAALAAGDTVIVEGLFARRVGPVPAERYARFDVFVDLAADLRLVRKIERKCLRDGFPLDLLLLNYLNQRRDQHARHVEPVRNHCDLVVDGASDPAESSARIWASARTRTAAGKSGGSGGASWYGR